MAAWELSLKEAMAQKERAGLRRRRLTRAVAQPEDTNGRPGGRAAAEFEPV